MKPAPLRSTARLVTRTELKPGRPLARTGFARSARTAVTASSPGRRGAGGRKPIKPVSDKRKAENRERRAMADAEFGRPDQGDVVLCAIRWGGGCTSLADDLDEVLSRGRGGSITDAANCRPGCRWCHSQLTGNPAEAADRGLVVPSGRPSKATPRRSVTA